MRVLVVNIFMFTLFLYPNRHFFMPRVLLQEIERKVLRFLTPITWTKLGVFSAVGALYGTQLFLQYLRLFQCRPVCCPLTKPGLTFAVVRSFPALGLSGDDDTQNYLSQSLPSVVQNDLRSIFSGILSELHIQKSCRNHRWETHLEHRVQAKGWDRSHVASYTTTPAQECASTSQMVSAESTPQCSHHFCQTVCQRESLMNRYNVVSVPDIL